MAMEKSSINTAKKASQDAERAREAADRLRAEVIEAAEQKAAADQKAVAAEGKAEWAAEELAAKVAELEGASRELVDLKGKVEAIELDPFMNVEYVSEFAYYLAYADAIRAAKKERLEGGPVISALFAFFPR
ncbi:hypothetical protein OROMI_006090 [Orobanche minor]